MIPFWGTPLLGPGLHNVSRLWELVFPDPRSQPHISISDSILSSTRPLVFMLITQSPFLWPKTWASSTPWTGCPSRSAPSAHCRHPASLSHLGLDTAPGTAVSRQATWSGQGLWDRTGSPPLSPNALPFCLIPGCRNSIWEFKNHPRNQGGAQVYLWEGFRPLR